MEPRSNRNAQRFAAVLLGAGALSIAGFVVFTAASRRAETRAQAAAFAVAAPGLAADGSRVVRLDVEGMTCPGCAKSVETELRKVSGVTACRVDVGRHLAEVRLASAEVTNETLVAAIEDAGYEARPEPAPPATP